MFVHTRKRTQPITIFFLWRSSHTLPSTHRMNQVSRRLSSFSTFCGEESRGLFVFFCFCLFQAQFERLNRFRSWVTDVSSTYRFFILKTIFSHCLLDLIFFLHQALLGFFFLFECKRRLFHSIDGRETMFIIQCYIDLWRVFRMKDSW